MAKDNSCLQAEKKTLQKTKSWKETFPGLLQSARIFGATNLCTVQFCTTTFLLSENSLFALLIGRTIFFPFNFKRVHFRLAKLLKRMSFIHYDFRE